MNEIPESNYNWTTKFGYEHYNGIQEFEVVCHHLNPEPEPPEIKIYYEIKEMLDALDG